MLFRSPVLPAIKENRITGNAGNVEVEKTRPTTQEDQEIREQEPEKKGFLKRLFQRNNKKKEAAAEQKESSLAAEPESTPNMEETYGPPEPPVIEFQTRYVKKTVSKLRSIEYVYKKVEGINSNCQYLLATSHGLLAGATSGLFVVSDHTAERIAQVRNISSISGPGPEGTCYVTHEDGLLAAKYNNNRWETRNIGPVREQLFSSVPADTFAYWASGYNVVYKIDLVQKDSFKMKDYRFGSVFPEELVLDKINDTLFLFSGTDIHYYNPEADTFMLYETLGIDYRAHSGLHYFKASGRDHWLKLDQSLFPMENDAKEKEDPAVLNLFDNIISLYGKNRHIYWLIDDYKRICQVDLADDRHTGPNDFQIFLDHISDAAGEYYDLSDPVFDPAQKMVQIKIEIGRAHV